MTTTSINEEEKMEQIPLRETINIESDDDLIKSLTVNGSPDPELGCCCLTTSMKSIKVHKMPHCLHSICSCFEELRWRMNLLGLYNPFNCIHCECKYGHYIARITISDMVIFIIFFLIEFIPLYDACISNIDDDHNKDANLKGIAEAFGHESVKNYALTFIFSQRNTIINIIFGLPFERAIIYHECLGVLSILFSWIHFILFLIYWNNTNIRNENITIIGQLTTPRNLTGFIAFICVNILGVFSYKYVRRHCWELFLKTHWIAVIGFLIFAWKHNSEFGGTLMIIVIVLWILDLFWRFWLIFGRKKSAKIVNVQYISGDIIKIEWMKERWIHDGGQWIFICFPTIDITQWHPFSITSGPKDDCLLLHIRCKGDWSERLKYLVINNAFLDWNKLPILVEGPYGRPTIPFHKYSSLILISGGIGCTPLCSIFSELMDIVRNQHYIMRAPISESDVLSVENNNNDNNNNNNNDDTVFNGIKRVHFVWSVKKCETIKEFDDIHWNVIKKYTEYDNIPNLKFAEDVMLNGVIIKTSYYVTRVKDKNEQNKWKKIYPNLYFERPKIGDIIDEAQQSLGAKCIGIMGCGPKPMIKDIRNQSAYRNIHCHTEVFNF